MAKKKEEYIYNLVPDDDIEEMTEDIDDIGEDTDEILRRMDRNLQKHNTINKRVTGLIALWILDKLIILGMLIWLQ